MENNTSGIITAEQAAEAAKGLTFEIVWAALMESRVRTDELYAQTQKQFDKTQKSIDEMSRKIGGIGGSLGDLTESMFSGVLWDKFEEYGIPVSSQSARKTFRDSNKKLLAEVDIFIENGQHAIPVEIKTKLSERDVDEHIERIETLRRYFDARGDKRKLLGAVAGGLVSEKILKYAQDNGLFVLVQSGECVTIADPPEGFKAREW